ASGEPSGALRLIDRLDLVGVARDDRADGVSAVSALQPVPGRQALDARVLLIAIEEPSGVFRKVGRVNRSVSYGGADDPVEHRIEQPVLAVEVMVDLGLVGLGGLRDAVDPCAGDTAGGELLLRGVEQALPR